MATRVLSRLTPVAALCLCLSTGSAFASDLLTNADFEQAPNDGQFKLGGGIEQAAQTVAGSTYDVSFLAGNSLSSGRAGTGIIKVSIDGGASTSFATAAANSDQMAWATRTFRFVAAGSTSTLRFWNDQDPFLHFAVIDGTSVVEHITTTPPVPEPQTWALLLCGTSVLGATRARR